MAFAGIFVLAGAGWALLAGAFLVLAAWRQEPDWRSLATRAGTAARRLGARVKAAPRRATAGGTGERRGGEEGRTRGGPASLKKKKTGAEVYVDGKLAKKQI